jgi:hypothetical protein
LVVMWGNFSAEAGMWLWISDATESSKLVAIFRVDSFANNSQMSYGDWGLPETSNKWD